MKNRHYIRAFGIPLLEEEAKVVERMSKEGYAPYKMSARRISFKSVKPENVRAKLIIYDIGSPGFLEFVKELKKQGWEYVCNDGIKTSIFVCSNSNSSAPKASEGSIKCAKRDFITHVILTVGYFILTLFTFLSNGVPINNSLNFSEIFASLNVGRRCCFIAMLVILLSELISLYVRRHNIRMLMGKAKPQKLGFIYYISWLLAIAFAGFAIAAIIGIFA